MRPQRYAAGEKVERTVSREPSLRQSHIFMQKQELMGNAEHRNLASRLPVAHGAQHLVKIHHGISPAVIYMLGYQGD